MQKVIKMKEKQQDLGQEPEELGLGDVAVEVSNQMGLIQIAKTLAAGRTVHFFSIQLMLNAHGEVDTADNPTNAKER